MVSNKKQKDQPAMNPMGVALFRWIASLKLAVVLMVVLAVILAAATLVEKSHGRDYAQWYVYNSSWFIALLGLFALNIIAAMSIRYPWGGRRLGFLLTHIGILCLLAGSIVTFKYGIEGAITFKEGDTARQYIVPREDEIIAVRQNRPGARSNMASVFSFKPGPVDWNEDKPLDLDTEAGIHLEILRYYHHAILNDNWLPDAKKEGKAALEFAVLGADGNVLNRAWLAADPFGGQMGLGPAQLAYYQAGANSLADDFLNPPKAEADTDGLLSMHYEGQAKRIPVRENIGKKIVLNDKGLAVEIVEYVPNARPSQSGKFTSSGNEPANPMLELQVYVPGKDVPQREISFAKQPMLSLDIMHGGACPIKFWYHHPLVPAATGVEFLQTPDGKLYARVGMDKKYESHGEVHKDDAIDVAGIFKLKVLQHLASAVHEATFMAADETDLEAAEQFQPAALIKVEADGATEQVWLHREDQEYASQQISTPDGPLTLRFDYKQVPIDFSLKLVSFKHGLNPGGMGDASYTSVVQLVDRAAKVDKEAEIYMNHPLTHGKFVFYQSGYDTTPDGKKVSTLSVGYDPGRTLKHVGSILVCVGTFMTFYMRKFWKKKTSAGADEQLDWDIVDEEPEPQTQRV